MPSRHPAVPRRWLMTDERIGEALWQALERLPRGSGVIFRHHSLPPAERRALFARVARVARRRGLVLLRAGADRLGREAGRHGGRPRRGGLHTLAVHHRRAGVAAARAGASAILVSPVFATRSHPGAPSLGAVRLGLMIAGLRVPVIALGGMDERRFRALRPLGLHGWAAIDAWAAPRQKRKAVPR